MNDLDQGEMKRLCDVLRASACAALQCAKDELRVTLTPEGLIELRIACIYGTRGLSSATLVGTFAQLDLWLSLKAQKLGHNALQLNCPMIS